MPVDTAVEGDGDSESNDESSDEESVSVSSEEPVNTALEDNDSEGAEITEESDLDDRCMPSNLIIIITIARLAIIMKN